MVVHAEGSIYTATVGNVGNFLEGLADSLCWSMEILPHVGTCVRSMQNRRFVSKCVNPQVKRKEKKIYRIPLKKKVFPFSSGVMASNSIPAHRSGRAALESSSFISEMLSVSQPFKCGLNVTCIWVLLAVLLCFQCKVDRNKKNPTFLCCILVPIED